MDAAGRAQAMDEIIAAQTRFLDGILVSTMLGDEKSSKRLYELLGKVADLVLDFHGASTAFLASSHAEVEARVKHQRSIAANTQKGAWGETKNMAEENAKRRAVFVHRTLANAERKFDNQKSDFKVCLRSRNPKQVALYKRSPALRLSGLTMKLRGKTLVHVHSNFLFRRAEADKRAGPIAARICRERS
jgi:hypothetical protein